MSFEKNTFMAFITFMSLPLSCSAYHCDSSFTGVWLEAKTFQWVPCGADTDDAWEGCIPHQFLSLSSDSALNSSIMPMPSLGGNRCSLYPVQKRNCCVKIVPTDWTITVPQKKKTFYLMKISSPLVKMRKKIIQ